ncbi:predicted protein [Naegleria gruberi]|uniref:peptidylprolyl isomerase n=1 Tax=Naegleria gruberi TaxID=5762 RepID=D2VNJ3_NAEGR|nr:uncharacterized protein NAEGRDRAFT_70521 [Naegleria gruberi]EFC41746.1 predicted protein [Naegleria gruberi]|eukprot:XP_002674490.1 predicted protein [Naegleria gruberi strain NEG-M]
MTNKKAPTTKKQNDDDLKFLQDMAKKNEQKQKKKDAKEQKKAALWISLTQDGLVKKKIITAAKDDAASPSNGNTVSVHYVGTLKSTGAQFDSSRTRNQPFEFKLGAHQVISGWEHACLSMKVGEKSIFELDSTYGYGQRGAPPSIPPNSTLVFEIELLGFN